MRVKERREGDPERWHLALKRRAIILYVFRLRDFSARMIFGTDNHASRKSSPLMSLQVAILSTLSHILLPQNQLTTQETFPEAFYVIFTVLKVGIRITCKTQITSGPKTRKNQERVVDTEESCRESSGRDSL
ncbi:uncharacterized protein LOC112451624 [Temnothorax curvispinosus]|uniref:Uncharacterized protein LOC112451624 n=1 Tax=Temnothorax curvispinosus TaxID=300111 RepID=A0A6J1PCK8_9HYME|nr:uncharacterized protein LOC112451624 [Temnothorax curvispinosus]